VRDTRLAVILERLRIAAFKVEGPASMHALLDNFLLLRLGMQIESNFPGIRFGGVLTCDFMSHPPISPFSSPSSVFTSQQREGWRQLHFVINIDHRMGEGQHWTAICVESNGREGSVEYVDSFGDPPTEGRVKGSRAWVGITDEHGTFESRMGSWLGEVCEAYKRGGVMMRRFVNGTQYQATRDARNCGVYAALYLLARANDIPPEEFVSAKIGTEQIERQRAKLYSGSMGYHPSPPNT
jgi:hypothetical protein